MMMVMTISLLNNNNNDKNNNLFTHSYIVSSILQNSLTASLQRSKTPPTFILDMTLNNLKVRLQ